MKKSGVLSGFMIGLGLLLTGCGNSFDYMPDLTEEESRLIAEYAAGILIRHDKYGGRLASDAQIAAWDEREATRLANVEELKALLQEESEDSSGDEEDGHDDSASGDAESGQAEAPFEGIAAFCGQEGFEISYMGHTLCDSYPPEDSEELVFAMDAAPGNQLLVLQFMAENITAEDRELNMLDQNVRFQVSVNEGRMDGVLPNLLLDDLSSYKGIIPAGNSIPLVLIREIPESEAAGITTVSLSLRKDSGSATTLLE